MDAATLAALVATVPDQAAVFAADLVQAQAVPTTDAIVAEAAVDRSAQEVAIDGVAWHVFNTLRGTADDFEGATFDDIRAIVAKGGF